MGAKQLKSLMVKIANNLVPEYLSDKFTSVNTIQRHNLRGTQHNLFILRPNTEALKESFLYSGTVPWNHAGKLLIHMGLTFLWKNYSASIYLIHFKFGTVKDILW